MWVAGSPNRECSALWRSLVAYNDTGVLESKLISAGWGHTVSFRWKNLELAVKGIKAGAVLVHLGGKVHRILHTSDSRTL